MGLLSTLKEYVNGEAEPNDVYYADDDDIIKIKYDKSQNRGKSLVLLEFSDRDEYNKLFIDSDDRDNNNNFLFNIAFNTYGSYDSVFIDASYHGDEEWKEGYIYRELSEENQEKFKNILKILNPSLYQKFIKNSDDSGAFKFIVDMFDREISDLSYEYSLLYDDALVTGLREYVKNKLCDKWNDFGIYEQKCGYKYLSTVNSVIKLWEKSGSNEDDDILKVLNNLNIKNDLIFDEDLFEDYYAYYDDKNFDRESFNRNAENNLDKIMEKVEEEVESGSLKQNIQIYDKLDSLGYEFNNWYKLPLQKTFGKESNIEFRINDVVDGKIIFLERKGGWGSNTEKYSTNLKNFLNYLYHPTLFESRF
jgi:hypothetical protein